MQGKKNIFFQVLKPNHFRLVAGLFILFFCDKATAQTQAFWDSVWIETPEMKPIDGQKPVFQLSEYCIENEVDNYLDSLAELKRKARLIPGFRILIYSGNDRELASKAKENAYRTLPRTDVYTIYQAPTFKVKLGDYFQKIDAYKDLRKLKNTFPQAVIIQEIVNIRN